MMPFFPPHAEDRNFQPKKHFDWDDPFRVYWITPAGSYYMSSAKTKWRANTIKRELLAWYASNLGIRIPIFKRRIKIS